MKKAKHLSVLLTVTVMLNLMVGCGIHGERRLPDTKVMLNPTKATTSPADETTSAVAESPSRENDALFSFASVSNLEFCFWSGAGAWRTVLTIRDDGTFEGEYLPSAMSSGNDYPNGICDLCDFTGVFTSPVKVDEYTYSVTLSQIKLEKEPGTEEIKDGVKYSYTEPYGIDHGKEFLFYLPGAPVQTLPEGYLLWMRGYGGSIGEELPFYGLYNVNEKHGFFSQENAELHALEESAQTAYLDLLSGNLSLLEDAQRWGHFLFLRPSEKMEYATLDLDGDSVSELLIQYIDEPSYYNAVFHYDDGKLFCWNSASCRDYPLQSGTMVHQYDYSGTRSYTMEDGSDSYIVRNVTHFVSPAALKQYMPDVDLPAQLGDFILNESAPLSNVGSVMQSANGAVLGLDVYLYINEENMLPDQIYPLPEKYHRPNYSLEYKNLLGVALTLFVYADETFTVENFTTQWDRVESISLDKGTLYVYYQQYEDGKEYPRGVLCDYPGVPGYVTLSKHDLLSEVSAEEMRSLIVNSLDALQNLPRLF